MLSNGLIEHRTSGHNCTASHLDKHTTCKTWPMSVCCSTHTIPRLPGHGRRITQVLLNIVNALHCHGPHGMQCMYTSITPVPFPILAQRKSSAFMACMDREAQLCFLTEMTPVIQVHKRQPRDLSSPAVLLHIHNPATSAACTSSFQRRDGRYIFSTGSWSTGYLAAF